MHLFIGNLTIMGSDNGFLPSQCQAIIWPNDRMLLVGPLGTNFSEILIKILTVSFNAFERVVCGMTAILSQPHCVNQNAENVCPEYTIIVYIISTFNTGGCGLN